MSYTPGYMARKTTTMTTEDVRAKFGMPGGVPKGIKVKLGPPVKTEDMLRDPTDELDPRNQIDPEEEEPAPKKKGALVILPQNPNFPGRQTIDLPSDQYTRGQRRAPSSGKTTITTTKAAERAKIATEVFAKRKGKKDKYVAPPIEDIVGEEKNPFTVSDLAYAAQKAEEAQKAFAKEEEENPVKTPSQRQDYNAAEAEFEKALNYARGMKASVSLEMARLQKELDRIEADQDAMDMCDTSFFDQDQADYYNDYADSLRDEKKKIEDEMDRIQGEPMKKRTQAKRATPRTKSRRVVKRRPSTSTSKPRRRKTTSSGRRSPGSPARSR